jgi:hypothetical protein
VAVVRSETRRRLEDWYTPAVLQVPSKSHPMMHGNLSSKLLVSEGVDETPVLELVRVVFCAVPRLSPNPTDALP